MDVHRWSLVELQNRLRGGELTPVEAVHSLGKAIDRIDPDVGGYLSRDLDAALLAAESADVSLPLGGIPIAIKGRATAMSAPASVRRAACAARGRC